MLKSKSKKILVAVTNDLSNDRRMHRICKSLSDQGYEVSLVGRRLKYSQELEKKTYHQKRFKLLFTKGILFYSMYNINLFVYILTKKVDVFYAVDLDTILPMAVHKMFRKKVKLIYDAHEYFTEVPEVTHRQMVKTVWHLIAKLCIPKTALCLTVSSSLAHELTTVYKKKFEIIRNVPYQKNIKNTTDQEKYIIYQGALNEGRGLEILITAMKDIPVKCYILGEGLLRKPLEELAQKLGLYNTKVFFTGMINPKDLADYTQNAWLGYNLLENKGKSYYYSLANKFFDYIQAGVPIINSIFPEYLEIQKKYPVSFFSEYDAPNLINTVIFLLKNEEKYLQAKENCFIAAQEFIWEKESQKLVTLVNQLFESK